VPRWTEDIGAALQAANLAPGATGGLTISLDDFPDLTAEVASGTISIDPGSVVLPPPLAATLP
jgi:hypothetical protein